MEGIDLTCHKCLLIGPITPVTQGDCKFRTMTEDIQKTVDRGKGDLVQDIVKSDNTLIFVSPALKGDHIG